MNFILAPVHYESTEEEEKEEEEKKNAKHTLEITLQHGTGF